MIKKYIIFKHLIIIFIVISYSSCSDKQLKEHRHEKYLSVYFDHGAWQGAYYIDNKENTFLYRSITTTITNDSTVPIRLTLDLLNKYNCPTSLNEGRLKLFILPKKLAKDKQFASGISKELKIFLDNELETPSNLNKIIEPNEEFTITIGMLNYNKDHGPQQMALISNGLKPHFTWHDSIISNFIKEKEPMDLYLGLDFGLTKNDSTCCSYLTIPCGHISFIKN